MTNSHLSILWAISRSASQIYSSILQRHQLSEDNFHVLMDWFLLRIELACSTYPETLR